jgi:hypothetical protein
LRILWLVCLFYDQSRNFVAIWKILWPFGIFYSNLVYFPCFGMLHQGKSGSPVRGRDVSLKARR